jgi:trans-2,3-dihydro-3-hydroxyanthranilate isomerase
MTIRYFVLDVFTATPLEGNPLAVVLDGDGLSDQRMQAIAGEFNLSETVFVLPPDSARHRARLRIFTPVSELPFAGHPTIGSAALLTILGGQDVAIFGLELLAGTAACAGEKTGEGAARVRFRIPRLPVAEVSALAAGPAAEALGLGVEDIGCHRHQISRFNAGVGYDCIPVASLDALARAKPESAFARTFRGPHPAAYVYTRVGEGAFQARMFAPGLGVSEDPATGSAAAAFAGALMRFEPPGDGVHDIEIAQGLEMGRPSRIALQLHVEAGALVGVELGGEAVIVMEGHLRL